MRDPARIEPMLQALAAVWRQSPDLRLGQLVTVAAGKAMPRVDPFYVEDDELLRALQLMAKEEKGWTRT